MRELSLLIKPVSGACNLRCSYCFYRDEAERRGQSDRGRMSMETVEALVGRAMSEATERVSFAFQGGEPTLAGLDFFRAFTDCVERRGRRGLTVDYSLQTNGLLLDDEWCAFLRDKGFLVGLSMDGYAALHDAHRRDAQGRESFARVQAAAERMRSARVDFNILCVVTNRVAKRGAAVYNWFRDQGYRFLQFIPCLNPFGAAPGPGEDSLTPENYGMFLNSVFDRWYNDYVSGCYVSVRMFDNWVRMMQGCAPETCSQAGCCTAYGCVEADGSVYPCDFYALDGWLLGRVETDGFEAMLTGPVAASFVAASRQPSPDCVACRWKSLCRGGCRRNRESGKNELCRAYQMFFSHAWNRLRDIARNS